MTNQRRTLAVSIATPGGDNPLLLSLIQTSSIFAGVAVSGLALVAKGGTAPYAFSILATSSNDLPDGLSVASLTGQITGTPTTPGHYTFIAQVQDDASNVFTHSFSIDVKAPFFGIAVTPRPGEIGIAYTYQFIVADATGTRLTSGYSVVDGTVPAGLTVHSNGIMDGTPTAPQGVSYFTLRATDGTYSIDFPIVVTIYSHVTLLITESFLGLEAENIPAITRNADYLIHAVASGGAPGGKYRLVEGDSSGDPGPWPTGIKIDPNNGTIYGRTSDPKTPRMSPLAFPFVGVSYTDGLGVTITGLWQYRIVNAATSSNGVPIPDDGDLPVFSSDDSVVITSTDDGLDLSVGAIPPSDGGIDTINGVGPDSSGNLPISSPNGSIEIGEDSSGAIALQTATRGGVTLRVGREDGPIISSGFRRTWILPASYKDIQAGTWEIFVSPNASTHIDVQYRSFGATKPSVADSIVGGTHPGVISGTNATGSQSGWSVDSIARGDFISIEMIDNDFAEEIVFFFPATKVS